MRSLDAGRHPLLCPVKKPMLSFFKFGERQGILSASERPALKGAESITQNGEKHLVSNAVDARLVDRPILKAQDNIAGTVRGALHIEAPDLITMAGAARSGVILRDYRKSIVGRIHYVVGQMSHRFALLAG
jgi:hypothetical protein